MSVSTLPRGLEAVRGISSEVSLITATQAADLLELWSYTKQRPLAPKFVSYLAGAISRGELTFLVLHLGSIGAVSRLVDGQHRLASLAALAALGKKDITLPAVIVDHQCASEAEVAALYARFDRGRIRSFGDIYQASGLPEQLGMSKRETAQFSAAAAVILTEFGPSNSDSESRAQSSQERARVMDEWALEAREYYGLLRGSTKEIQDFLNRAAVAAVGIITFRYQEAKAREFWGQVVADEGSQGEASRALLTFLRAHKAHHRPRHLYARYVASTWNAHFAGLSITRPAIKNPELPILILGTPYTRRS